MREMKKPISTFSIVPSVLSRFTEYTAQHWPTIRIVGAVDIYEGDTNLLCADVGLGEFNSSLPGATAEQDVPIARRDGTAVWQRLPNISVSSTVSAESREHH